MDVRRPAVAGQFYPGNAQKLQREVEDYLITSQIGVKPERVAAIVAPHAGYMYSGPTAGFAYARVRGKKPTRVILMGCSHRYHVQGASVFDAGSFETPLGNFPIDEPFAKKLAKEMGSVSAQPHGPEHCLEVHLPFLWVAVGPAPIVPVLFGSPATEWHVAMGRKLAETVDENDLVVASTDLSHYLPEPAAHLIDKRTLDTALSKDCAALIEGLARETCSMCGGSAVVTAMAFALARGATSWSVLDYRTSAWASGDHSQVVGYASIAMERPA